MIGETERSKELSIVGGGDVPFKVGIIGCGQLGTIILTKLIETMDQFENLKIYVSTRQPHLLRSF